MRKTLVLFASMAAALVLATVMAFVVPNEQAQAALPDINGKIAFVSDRDDEKGKSTPQAPKAPI